MPWQGAAYPCPAATQVWILPGRLSRRELCLKVQGICLWAEVFNAPLCGAGICMTVL